MGKEEVSTEIFTIEELLATRDEHNPSYDGYCTCNGDNYEALYEIEHLLDVMRKARQK